MVISNQYFFCSSSKVSVLNNSLSTPFSKLLQLLLVRCTWIADDEIGFVGGVAGDEEAAVGVEGEPDGAEAFAGAFAKVVVVEDVSDGCRAVLVRDCVAVYGEVYEANLVADGG